MKTETEIKKTAEITFDWNAFMRFFFETQGEREKIGPAWFLFFDICSNANKSAMYSGTYQTLGKRYNAAPITVKKWRRYLSSNSVIESFTRGHLIVFRLNEPYLSFLRPAPTKEESGPKDFLIQAILKAIKDESLMKVS